MPCQQQSNWFDQSSKSFQHHIFSLFPPLSMLCAFCYNDKEFLFLAVLANLCLSKYPFRCALRVNLGIDTFEFCKERQSVCWILSVTLVSYWNIEVLFEHRKDKRFDKEEFILSCRMETLLMLRVAVWRQCLILPFFVSIQLLTAESFQLFVCQTADCL